MNLDESHGTWLISFADLLTLVLCTFLMLFSLTWHQHKVAGTQIAQHPSEVGDLSPKTARPEPKRGFEMQWRTSDFEQGILTEEGRQAAINWLTSMSYAGQPMRVSLCEGSGLTVQDLVPLIRQLFDIGVAKESFRIDVGGSECEKPLAATMRLYG